MNINSFLKDISIYEPGQPIETVMRKYGIEEKDIVKLASNENPLGTSPMVQSAICENSSRAHMYPDDSMFELKDALSGHFGIESDNIIIGAGSDQILEFISHLILYPGASILTSAVSFAMYDIYARQFGAKVYKTDSYRHIPAEFTEAIGKHRPNIVFLCTPNNPTGDAITLSQVKEIIEFGYGYDPFFVVDGAYMEYAATRDDNYSIDPSELLDYDNVLYTGTFSKAYGLGGMRAGYGIANSTVIKNLNKVRPPFNVGTLSLIAAKAALEDKAFLERSLRLHIEQMDRYEQFAISKGIEYIKSYTNFVTYIFENERLNCNELVGNLISQGIIIRDLSSYGMNAIRITIGTEEPNSRLLNFLDKIIPE